MTAKKRHKNGRLRADDSENQMCYTCIIPKWVSRKKPFPKHERSFRKRFYYNAGGHI